MLQINKQTRSQRTTIRLSLQARALFLTSVFIIGIPKNPFSLPLFPFSQCTKSLLHNVNDVAADWDV
jgi:hypothetical protein